jgi:hypothetical protein
MDWLRSEDLKDKKNVTAPIFIIGVESVIARGVKVRPSVWRHPDLTDIIASMH